MPLVGLENTDTLQAVAAVPATQIATLKSGDTLPVRIPDLALTITGTVAEIAPAADAASRTTTVKLNLPAVATLRPGQFARVVLPGPASKTLLVPVAAVSRFGQMERLFVVDKSTAHLRLVRSGQQREGQVEILSGLDPGEQVVVGSDSPLIDGQAVRIAP
jgi:RND family efflux transporter MFP subunit